MLLVIIQLPLRNVRGLHEGSKHMRISNLLKTWKANIVTLQDTKLEQMSLSIVRRLWGGQPLDWCQLDPRGGLLVVSY